MGQQLGRFLRRHPKGRADLRWRGDAPLVQLAADRHPQTDTGDAVLVTLAPLGAGEFRLCWLLLAHACQVVEVRPVVTWAASILASPIVGDCSPAEGGKWGCRHPSRLSRICLCDLTQVPRRPSWAVEKVARHGRVWRNAVG